MALIFSLLRQGMLVVLSWRKLAGPGCEKGVLHLPVLLHQQNRSALEPTNASKFFPMGSMLLKDHWLPVFLIKLQISQQEFSKTTFSASAVKQHNSFGQCSFFYIT
jgi:hypothetical protein